MEIEYESGASQQLKVSHFKRLAVPHASGRYSLNFRVRAVEMNAMTVADHEANTGSSSSAWKTTRTRH